MNLAHLVQPPTRWTFSRSHEVHYNETTVLAIPRKHVGGYPGYQVFEIENKSHTFRLSIVTQF